MIGKRPTVQEIRHVICFSVAWEGRRRLQNTVCACSVFDERILTCTVMDENEMAFYERFDSKTNQVRVNSMI